MRGTLFHRIGALLLLLPLFGCAQSVDLSADPATQISVTSVSPVAVGDNHAPESLNEAASLLSAGELGALSESVSGTLVSSDRAGFVSDAPPFVRNRPKAVPPFPLVLNHSIQSYIDGYLAQPAGLRQSFERSGPFMPEMTSLFEAEGLPPDLVYLAFAESAFSAKGAGPWQLNKVTARRYGLTINRWIDERRDPIKSTRAAVEYLAELHDQTGSDWRMTLVAWNNGDGGVNRYIRLMTAPYERLMRRLPRRTRSLMNRFMAVALIARHAKEYGLYQATYAGSPPYRVIAVDGGASLSSVARANNTTIRVLRRLNPALLGDSTPPGPQPYLVRIPSDSIESKLLASDS